MKQPVSETHRVELPLAVDLDTALLRSNLLLESIFAFLRHAPGALLRPPWAPRQWRRRVIAEAPLEPADLPYDRELLRWLAQERERGRLLVLVTALPGDLARAIAATLGIFDDVIADDGQANPDGAARAEGLRRQFGSRGFDWVGAADDWLREHARYMLPTPAAEAGDATSAGGRLRLYAQALRLHQWAKNGLLFVPLVAAHRFTDLAAIGATATGFVAFCLCASSVYLLNDLIDLGDDRRHPRKRTRPFASGALPLSHGVALIPALLAVAFGLALALPREFLLVLGGYYGLTLAYSLGLKQWALVDVLALAGLYTVRIIAGGAVASVPLSFWLLALSVFLFLSLAMAKRCAELASLRERGESEAHGRGYQAADLASLHSLGTAAGYVAVLVLALYINSPSVADLYSRPDFIWLLCPIMLYWVSRVWLTTLRGQMHDDPVVFAIRDRGSQACALLGAGILWLAI